jgi:hypothetical protein
MSSSLSLLLGISFILMERLYGENYDEVLTPEPYAFSSFSLFPALAQEDRIHTHFLPFISSKVNSL